MASPQRVVVYLGASAPVHITHVHLVRALLDEGHDRVFVFLLRWRPERFGTSADAGAEQLRTWLAKLPPADLARLDLQAVQHDHEAGTKMRQALGAGVDPEVEVCFSQKYKEQEARINAEWLPLYTKEFPGAKPRWLTDETDPGAEAWGTAKFVDAVQRFKDTQGSPEAEAAEAELNTWRPELEDVAGWASYIKGLLQGAHGEPFYTSAGKSALEEFFFSDTEVLSQLDAAGRSDSLPGGAAEFLKDKKNRGTFWKQYAQTSDEALFKQVCLRRQGVTAPVEAEGAALGDGGVEDLRQKAKHLFLNYAKTLPEADGEG